MTSSCFRESGRARPLICLPIFKYFSGLSFWAGVGPPTLSHQLPLLIHTWTQAVPSLNLWPLGADACSRLFTLGSFSACTPLPEPLPQQTGWLVSWSGWNDDSRFFLVIWSFLMPDHPTGSLVHRIIAFYRQTSGEKPRLFQ
jgi:hypothetical protein